MKILLIIIILFITNATYSQEVLHWRKIYLNNIQLPIGGMIIIGDDSITLYHYPYGYLKWKIDNSFYYKGNTVYNLICGDNKAILIIQTGSILYSYKLESKYDLVKIIIGRKHQLKE